MRLGKIEINVHVVYRRVGVQIGKRYTALIVRLNSDAEPRITRSTLSSLSHPSNSDIYILEVPLFSALKRTPHLCAAINENRLLDRSTRKLHITCNSFYQSGSLGTQQ